MPDSAGTAVNWLPLLPQELRDKIYKYVLTEEGGLLATSVSVNNDRFTMRLATHTNHPERESNQLRCVCRQLYIETNGLGLCFNNVTFIGPRQYYQSSPYQQFKFFTRNVSRTHWKHLHHITIIDYRTHIDAEPTGSIITPATVAEQCNIAFLRYFCQCYPSTTVVVRLDWRSRSGAEYLARVDTLSHLLRERSPLSKTSKNNGDIRGLHQFEGLRAPDNLRFTFTVHFELELARYGLEQCGRYHGVRELDNMVKRLRMVHENGI